MKGKESHFRVSRNDIGHSSYAREAMRSRTTTTRLEGHRTESGAVGFASQSICVCIPVPLEGRVKFLASLCSWWSVTVPAAQVTHIYSSSDEAAQAASLYLGSYCCERIPVAFLRSWVHSHIKNMALSRRKWARLHV